MILTPKTFAGDLAAMAGFFRAAHEGSGIAIMLQNAPAPMGIGMPLEQVAEGYRAIDERRAIKTLLRT